MLIDKLEIKGFGKLTERTILFKNGINIIYGGNEAGKTTLQWFIKSMLYGFKNNRQSRYGLSVPQKRFEPWDCANYGGALRYSLDDGSTYRVERNFKSGEVQIFDSHFNNITGFFEMGRDKIPLIAERHLGLDDATFERTVMIKQLEIRLDESAAASLAEKLTNVNNTGFEDISFSKTQKALSEALKNNVGTVRTTTQPLDKLELELKQLEQKHNKLYKLKEQRRSTWEELLEIRSRRIFIEAEARFLEHLSKLIEVRKELDINLKKESQLKETVRNLNELELALADTKKAFKNTVADAEMQEFQTIKKYRASFAFCLAAAVLFAVLFVYTALNQQLHQSWVFLLAYGAGVLSAGVAGVVTYRRNYLPQSGKNSIKSPLTLNNQDTSLDKSKIDTINERCTELKLRIKNSCDSVSVLFGKQLIEPAAVKQELMDISAKLEKLSLSLDQGIGVAKEMACKTSGHFTENELEVLFYDSSITHLEEAWRSDEESTKNRLLSLSLNEKYYEGLLDDRQEDSDELQRLEEETIAVKEKITYLKYKGKALKLAQEVLQEAALDIKRTYTSDLDSKLSAIITGITAGRYVDLRGDDRLSLKVAVPENGDIKNVNVLSGAASDQMYLALRLAMAGMLTAEGESLPLIMDEVFAQFDDERAALALKYLHREYSKKQVLLFTCKQREVELAREICGSSMNFMEL